MPEQAHHMKSFFSMFYASINGGSLISTILTPILRQNTACFGQDSCYPLAFGVPAALMIVAICKKCSRFYMSKPTENRLNIKNVFYLQPSIRLVENTTFFMK